MCDAVCCGIVAAIIGSVLFEFLWPYVIAKRLGISKDVKKFGEWAVITGATDGIGKAYAQILAAKGMKLCLISRTQERLDQTAKEIVEATSASVKTIAFDFGTTKIADYAKLEEQLKKLDIGVLVNNVGMGYGYPEYFHKFPGGKDEIQKLIQVNCTSGAMLTHMVLPAMVEKHKGAIVNISSASGLFVAPLISLYSGSKAFMDMFTRGLQVEYAGSGVIIQAVAPFFVTTKLARLRTSTFFAPSPMDYVRSAVSLIGVQATTVGYMSHGLQLMAIRIFPQWLIAKLAFGQMAATRKRALKKLEEQQKSS